MPDINIKSEVPPTHSDIERRAYELYLARRQERQEQDWLLAEEQLRSEHRERVGQETTGFVAGLGGVAKTGSSQQLFCHRRGGMASSPSHWKTERTA